MAQKSAVSPALYFRSRAIDFRRLDSLRKLVVVFFMLARKNEPYVPKLE
jgi:hypothetical protein